MFKKLLVYSIFRIFSIWYLFGIIGLICKFIWNFQKQLTLDCEILIITCLNLCNFVPFCWKLLWTHWCTCMSQAHRTFPSRNAVQISLGPNAQWNGSRFARGFTRFHCPFSFLHMFKVLRTILQFYKLEIKCITIKCACFLLELLS